MITLVVGYLVLYVYCVVLVINYPIKGFCEANGMLVQSFLGSCFPVILFYFLISLEYKCII